MEGVEIKGMESGWSRQTCQLQKMHKTWLPLYTISLLTCNGRTFKAIGHWRRLGASFRGTGSAH